jgi:dipeptidyl aminopeptidase/acylaminoacyl peptidase
MTDTRVLPYGSWPSPLSAADVARGGVRLSFVALHGDDAWWEEGRAAEEGRVVVVRRGPDGTARDAVPASWNVRTRVHEYGGRAWLPVTWHGRDALVAARWEDQRLYLLDPHDTAAEPRPLTPAPARPGALRYVEPVLGTTTDEVWCVREAHGDDGVSRHVVAVPLDGRGAAEPDAVRTLVGGSDFLACVRPSPDGRHLAWVAWDHPRMPWDGSELRVAPVRADGTCGEARTLLGAPEESVAQVEWADDATLYAASDRTGFWNLYALGLDGDAPHPLCPRDEEFGLPLWAPGFSSYALLGDGRLVVGHGSAVARLGVLDPATGALEDLDLGFDSRGPAVVASGSTVIAVLGGATRPDTVLRVDVPAPGATAPPAREVVRTSPDPAPDPAFLPLTRQETFPGPGGREVHALVSPPRNPDATGPDGALPPYVVFVHGGPTAHVQPRVDLTKAYLTSRGVGVVDVNYGGSTGYGRAYRERLREQWGVVDVEDCVAAAQGLVDRGEADGSRLAIRGGSAGGWTTLAALTRTDAFDAGVSAYGVAELLRFAEDTHDFESRYLDGLVGPLPAARDRYVERAPLTHVDGVSCPVLLLQGLEDEVVPPSQSEMFADALDRKGIPYAYLAFEGEQHGFRREETQVAALEAELSFYGQVFGFATPGVPTLVLRHAEALPTA